MTYHEKEWIECKKCKRPVHKDKKCICEKEDIKINGEIKNA